MLYSFFHLILYRARSSGLDSNDLTDYQAIIRTFIHLNHTEVGLVKRKALESFYFHNRVEEQMFYEDLGIILGGYHFNYLDAIDTI